MPYIFNPFTGNLDWTEEGSFPVVDTTAIVKGSADDSKRIRFEVDGLSASTTRVLTVPDQNVDFTPNTGTFPAAAHAGRHTDGNDDIQSATNAQKGVATAAHITAIEANTLKVTNATHTGEVTGSVALTIAAGAVTYAKMQNISATDIILGRSTAGAGSVEEIACTAAGRALLDDANATAQRSTLNVDVAGTDNSTDVTLNASATTGGMSISTQEISNRAATNAQTGYATAAHITALELATAIENYADSPMVVSGGVISEGTTGTFTVAALTCLLRTTDSVTGSLVYLTLAEQANQAITAANTTYFVSLNYNGGSPSISVNASNPYTADKRNIPIGKVMKDSGDDVHFISGGFNFQDAIRKLQIRGRELRGFELASGSAISYSGTNNFISEAGVAYAGMNRITFSQYVSASTQFTAVYDDGGTGWTEADANTIDYNHYDDGDGTLGNVGVAKYGTFYVYRHIGDGHVYVVYGTSGSYSLAAAEAAPVPTVPAYITDFGVFIGKIITPQAGGSFSLVQMVTDTSFTAVQASDHGQLAGLGDDDHSIYLLIAGSRAMTGDLN